jgi:RHS repeat-associated protein
MQARYYDPVIGRFYSNDPVDFMGHIQRGNSAAHGFGRYTYANNNPYKYTDPDGEFGIIGALIGGGIDAAIQIGNGIKNGQGVGEAIMNVDLGSVAVSAALGAVTGGATALLKGAATGTTKIAGASVQLTTKTERAVVGSLGANKAAAAGFIQAERKGKEGMQGAAAQVVNGVTSPVPVGTIIMESAAMLTGSDEQQAPEAEKEIE